MRFLWVMVPALTGVISLAVVANEALELPWGDEEAVARGAETYADFCAACHGDNLEGQQNWQQRQANGRLRAPPQDETGHTWHHSAQSLFELVKLGPATVIGGDYQSDMPGFGDTLSDQEIIEVLAFIKSTWPAELIEAHTKHAH